MNWTETARNAFNTLCHLHVPALISTGADPEEVRGDWERHIECDAAERGLPTVTEEQVRRMLRILAPMDDGPAAIGVDGPALRANRSEAAANRGRSKTPARLGMAFFGVFLPFTALFLELTTRAWASALFNPLPTLWHPLLIAVVPVANLWLLASSRKSRVRHPRLLSILNAIAIAVSFYYSLLFLPIMPFCVLGIAFLGLGLIPLAPYFGLLVAIRLRYVVKTPLKPRLWHVAVPVLLLLMAPDVRQVATHVGLSLAASPDSARQARGVRLLRRWTRRDDLLHACYAIPRDVDNLYGFILSLNVGEVPQAKIRDVYYRVTGVPFNAVRPPSIRRLSGGMMYAFDDIDWEEGGDAVAARAQGLHLHESAIDGIMHPTAGTSYTEWSMVFRNDAESLREARTRIQLPPGGVVSRLTLWVDGEPREAAFSAKSRVKAAYKRVVERRRDPVLVTWCGPDQVLVQCFPVPIAGTMKIRIGITAPLSPDGEQGSLLRLPSIVERNFGIPAQFKHGLWFESAAPITCPPPTMLDACRGEGGGYALRGPITPAILDAGMAIRSATPIAPSVWAPDTRAPDTDTFIHQELRPAPARSRPGLVIVIDGSQRMAPYLERLAATLADGLPASHDVSILVAGDNPQTLLPPSSLTDSQARARLKHAVQRIRVAGGCDNIPALGQAWDQAATNAADVLWVHATQPLALTATEGLEQRLRRRPGGPRVMDLQLGPGPNRVQDALHGTPAWRPIPCLRGGLDDLAALLHGFSLASPHRMMVRSRKHRDTPLPEDAIVADLHLARLWAHGEIARLDNGRSDEEYALAMELATTYQLVTPISGAIVLETEAQYEQAGLSPVDAASVPEVVPEPGTLWLLLTGGVTALVALRRRIQRRVA